MDGALKQADQNVRKFLGGSCDFKTLPFCAFVVMSIFGVCATAVSADLTGPSKARLLAVQATYTVVGAIVIGYLSAHCRKGWAWLALVPIVCLPIY